MLLGLISIFSAAVAVLACWLHNGFDSLACIWLAPVCFLGSFLVLIVLAFLFFWLMCRRVDMEKPQEEDSPFYRGMMHLYVEAILTLARVRVTARGMEKIPEDGRFLLVSNHRDNVDPAFLLTCFRKKQLAFINKREAQSYFLVGPIMHKLLCQSINRENDREALKTILKCIQILKEDKASIAVFPEGYIQPDRKLHRFRPGVFKIATKAEVPIVVCTLRGTPEVLPSFKKLKPSHVEVRLLEVISPKEYENITTVELSDRIYHLMAADLGPELVHQEEDS